VAPRWVDATGWPGAAGWRHSARPSRRLSGHRAPPDHRQDQRNMTEFTFPSLRAVLLNYPRTGTDPVYDPLGPSSCTEGLARLTGLGEIEQL